ncbi:MAG: hypothetical protein DI551_06130 [Micavibrio aeruginosavorus]|uniref:DUF5667 domain-containing protein n=1 Tax=Micavibrio aeruginosavorus TaxID=349221 RepID=A0A2W5MZV0_9BACT|nr:MAG: hypothetical protein DI551_06130 [Micavibrio aeruginosavorus]
MTRSSLLLSAVCLSFLLSASALAAEEKAQTKPVAEKPVATKPATKKEEETPDTVLAQPKKTEETPVTKWIAAENALIDPLSDKDKESFFILRNKYSMIRVTRVVERDIGAAVESCGDKNADIKAKMDARYKQWKNAVDPILDTAKKQLDKDLASQKIVDPKKAKNVLDLNDEAYVYSEKQITKMPVSTKEACENLLMSMDHTEDNMVTLLQQTLLPENVIRQRRDAIKREQEKQKDKAKKQEAKSQDAAKKSE